MKKLSINKCPHGHLSVSIDDDEKHYATMISPSKCCGRYSREVSWPLSKIDMKKIVTELIYGEDEAGSWKD